MTVRVGAAPPETNASTEAPSLRESELTQKYPPEAAKLDTEVSALKTTDKTRSRVKFMCGR